MENLSPQKPSCAFCNSLAMFEIIDFGEVALAGAFLKPRDFSKEKLFPLNVFFCDDCYATQVVNIVPAQVMFEDYFYFSSSINTLSQHFKHYADEITARFASNPSTTTVLEFGCNDGVLLKPLADKSIGVVIGVDPAKNVVASIEDERINIYNDYFNEATADTIVANHGAVDIVIANNVYAHIPDIQGATRAVANVLSDDGVFIFEVHYLGKVINDMQYDMIYHEHLYYYSLLSAINHFKRYDMTIFDVKRIPIHAGSVRFYVCRNGSKYSAEISPAVNSMVEEELVCGFDQRETFIQFSEKVSNQNKELMGLLNKLKNDGATIAGYGASGRANTIIQSCGITNSHLDYMIDDAPAKKGYFTPGSHLEIFDRSVLTDRSPPDYLLIFAWSFLDEIINKNRDYMQSGGKLIIPLPKVQIYKN